MGILEILGGAKTVADAAVIKPLNPQTKTGDNTAIYILAAVIIAIIAIIAIAFFNKK